MPNTVEVERKFDRRFALIGMVTAGASIVVTSCDKKPNTPSPEELARYRKRVDDKYQIAFLTEEEKKERMKLPIPPDPNYNPKTDIITYERVKMLDEYLGVLPSHFYAPEGSGEQKGQRMAILLLPEATAVTVENQRYGGIFFNSMLWDEVYLNSSRFHEKDRQVAFRILVHELVHRITPELQWTKSQNPKFDPKAPTPWFDRIYSLLGGKFNDQILDEYRAKVEKEIERVRASQKSMSRDEFVRQWYVYYGLRYGLSKKTAPDEFLAVLGPDYTYGRNTFIKYYTPIFGEETANMLYEFVRDEIFKGKEYDKFPIRAQRLEEVTKIVRNWSVRKNRMRQYSLSQSV